METAATLVDASLRAGPTRTFLHRLHVPSPHSLSHARDGKDSQFSEASVWQDTDEATKPYEGDHAQRRGTVEADGAYEEALAV